MTNLSLLRVSLTKHGAHKIAPVILKYDVAHVLRHVEANGADLSQARKNLSVLESGDVPTVWAAAKSLGEDAVNAVVLIAIIFSHSDLIKAMMNASDRKNQSGRIDRDDQLTGKAYTNFARILEQLGYAPQSIQDPRFDGVRFDLAPILSLPGVGELASEILALKLVAAGWDQDGSVIDEAIALGFEQVFGLSKSGLRSWLDVAEISQMPSFPAESVDLGFFVDDKPEQPGKKFEFKPGHRNREILPQKRNSSRQMSARQLHNAIQNELYAYLSKRLGQKHVGTEVDTGLGTSVDLVTQKDGHTTFYEIKTATSSRTNIRQALPQLLEYSFWPPEERADELVIVGPVPMSSAAKIYLENLIKRFGIPIQYRVFDLSAGVLLPAP